MYRVQKLLSIIGYCSRRSAEELIRSGQIKINDKIAVIGDKWKEGDTLKINNKEINLDLAYTQNIRVIKYHKPVGEIVSVKDPHNLNTVFEHLPKVDSKWINIGRLDLNTSGLILFTNHGDLANRLMHPSYKYDREYIVTTDKPLSKRDIDLLLTGVPINDGDIGKFDDILASDNNTYNVVLSTGKNKEIRNSLKYLKLKTISLHRIRYSSIKIGDLKEGEYKDLTDIEISNFLT